MTTLIARLKAAAERSIRLKGNVPEFDRECSPKNVLLIVAALEAAQEWKNTHQYLSCCNPKVSAKFCAALAALEEE